MSEEKTYQPKWDRHVEYQHQKHHHHHHGNYDSSSLSDRYTNTMGGAMKMKDKSADYGLMFILIVALGYGAFKLIGMFAHEINSMPLDDPNTEMNVDELRIRKVEEQDAILMGDSLAHAYNLDSIKHTVQIETRPVYRPPKRENTWYITKREWQSIWRNYKVWRWNKKREREENDLRRKENSSRDSE